jgi:acyl-CoA reductase-like NAD-dependent aldehyde dehydrogenase
MQERIRAPKLPTKAHESMRIAGKLVDADERLEVRNPYTGSIVATVPAANPAQVAEAFKIGHELTRCERQKILLRIAEILAQRRDELAVLMTMESATRLDYITRFINELEVGTVNVWEVPHYRIEPSPFGGIKDSGLGYKEGV